MTTTKRAEAKTAKKAKPSKAQAEPKLIAKGIAAVKAIAGKLAKGKTAGQKAGKSEEPEVIVALDAKGRPIDAKGKKGKKGKPGKDEGEDGEEVEAVEAVAE